MISTNSWLPFYWELQNMFLLMNTKGEHLIRIINYFIPTVWWSNINAYHTQCQDDHRPSGSPKCRYIPHFTSPYFHAFSNAQKHACKWPNHSKVLVRLPPWSLPYLNHLLVNDTPFTKVFNIYMVNIYFSDTGW